MPRDLFPPHLALPALNRRQFLLTGAAAVPALNLATIGVDAATGASPPDSTSPVRRTNTRTGNPPGRQAPRIYARYADLLTTLKNRGHNWRQLGIAPDGSSLISVRCGGDRLPAIFISAGSHSTEHAGVSAAVELIDQLETPHQVHVLPCRDPIGLGGFRHALSLSLGDVPDFQTMDEAESLLRQEGEILYDEQERLLVRIGEYGYATRSLYRHIPAGAECLKPLRGRRLWWPSQYRDVEGSGPFQRAYTQIVTPDSEILHLNRFHDTAWAPLEPQAAAGLMNEIKPELSFDLHEYGGNSFWMSARKQQTPEEEELEIRMARACTSAIAASGAKLAPEDYSPGSFFRKIRQGAFLLEAKQRGEGLNLIDFAGRNHGPGFTVETGMRQQPFQERVRQHMLVVQTAVRMFEEFHA